MFRAMRESNECGFDAVDAGEVLEGQKAGKPTVARSTFMRAEEIEKERAESGWNPYAGEEETEISGSDEEEQIQPYFMTSDYTQIMEEQQETERELRRLQSFYPDTAKLLLPFVEEECDKMEYEGSPMFDEYPDRTTVYRMEERIYDQVKDQLPEEEKETPGEILSMQYPDPARSGSGRSLARDLARVLLLQEMHHRRCRHRRCRQRHF